MKKSAIHFVLLAAVLSVSPAFAAEAPRVVFQRGTYPDAQPWIADIDGTDVVPLADVNLASYPRLANNTVVFMLEDFNGQGDGIYKMEAYPGAKVTKIPNTENIRTANGLNWDAIDISPDGSRIAWAAPEGGDYYQNHNVFVANIDGSGKTRVLRNTSKHYFMINWGEPNRIALSASNVGSATSQRPHTMKPDGSDLTQAVADFSQYMHIGGPAGRAVMTWTVTPKYLVTMDNSFGDFEQIPGPKYGYSFTSWHPTEDAIFGSRDGNLYRVERTTGAETLIALGGGAPCAGGDVGIASDYMDPWSLFSACSDELGCGLGILSYKFPPAKVASMAVGWCQVVDEFLAKDYDLASRDAVLVIGDLLIEEAKDQGEDVFSLAAASDCLEVLWGAYHDDVINGTSDWIDEVKHSASVVFGFRMPFNPFAPVSEWVWSLWIMSPVTVTASDGLGNSLVLSDLGGVQTDDDIVGTGAVFGDHQKFLLLHGDEDSDFEVTFLGSGASPGDSFSLEHLEMTSEQNWLLEFLDVPTDEGAKALLDLESPPDVVELLIDLDGDDTYEDTFPPGFVDSLELLIMVDDFESGDTTSWSKTQQ